MANIGSFDSKLGEAIQLYEKLKTEWSRKPPNLDKTSDLLNALKVNFNSTNKMDRLNSV